MNAAWIKPRLAAVLAVVVVRWLTAAHLTLTVAGASVSVPALVLVAAALVALAALAVALLVYRTRAERAMLAAWQTQKAATS
jgi:ABC-type uncharacterized transport system YnjBCD permease subunit